MTTTGALYPEVRELLERPDRIRREAFELLDRCEVHKLAELAGKLRVTVRRMVNGLGHSIAFDVDDPQMGARRRAEAVKQIRGQIYERLVEILEADPEAP